MLTAMCPNCLHSMCPARLCMCPARLMTAVHGPWSQGLPVSTGNIAIMDQSYRTRKDGGELKLLIKQPLHDRNAAVYVAAMRDHDEARIPYLHTMALQQLCAHEPACLQTALSNITKKSLPCHDKMHSVWTQSSYVQSQEHPPCTTLAVISSCMSAQT